MVAPADTIAAASAIAGAAGVCDPIDITTMTVETGEQVALTLDMYLTDISRGIIEHDQLFTHSAWVAWTCPADGRYAFSLLTSSADWDSTLQVYTSGADNSPAALALRKVSEADDASSTIRLSRVAFDATAATVYLVRISGWSAAAAINTILSWAQVEETVTNDSLTRPDPLSGLTGRLDADTLSSREPVPLEHFWEPGSEAMVWYRFTPVQSGVYQFISDPDVSVAVARDDDDPRAGGGGHVFVIGSAFTVAVDVDGAVRLGLSRSAAAPGAVGMDWSLSQATAMTTIEVATDAATTPMVPVVAPPSNYAGDDATDLVTYPDPVLDAFGRPLP